MSTEYFLPKPPVTSLHYDGYLLTVGIGPLLAGDLQVNAKDCRSLLLVLAEETWTAYVTSEAGESWLRISSTVPSTATLISERGDIATAGELREEAGRIIETETP